MTRYADQYDKPDLRVSLDVLEAWTPEVLAREELGHIRSEVQVVLAAITSVKRRQTIQDQAQLAQALSHLRRMRTLWCGFVVNTKQEPDGEGFLPREALRQGAVWSVRDWTFARGRRAIARRDQYVTIARQIPKYSDRPANRIATYFSTDLNGVVTIRGGQ